MLDKIKEKLKNKFVPSEPVQKIENWAVVPHTSEYFDESFYIISYLPDGKIFRTGIIAYQDWKTGEAEDVFGQKYQLGEPSAEYLSYLRSQNSDLLKFLVPKVNGKEIRES